MLLERQSGVSIGDIGLLQGLVATEGLLLGLFDADFDLRRGLLCSLPGFRLPAAVE
jgi:hypothetical protein